MQQDNRARVSQTWEDDDEDKKEYLSGMYESHEREYEYLGDYNRVYDVYTYYSFNKNRYTLTYIAGEGPLTIRVSHLSTGKTVAPAPADEQTLGGRVDKHEITEGTYSISDGYIEFNPDGRSAPTVYSFAKTENTILLDGVPYTRR
jgi:hypothetical protein